MYVMPPLEVESASAPLGRTRLTATTGLRCCSMTTMRMPFCSAKRVTAGAGSGTFCSGGGGAVCVHDPRSTSSSLLALAPGPWTLPAPDTELHARRRIGARLTAAGVVLIRAPREPAAAAVGGHVRSPGDWRGTRAPARAPQEDRAPNDRCNP